MTTIRDANVNLTVTFSQGQVPEILKRLEQFLGIALSFRSNTGEVVVKTDYFNGPCSLIRGTERGKIRCRRTYKNVEDRLLRRKVPFVNICYAGFLVFAVPVEFRGEMVGTLLGSQILPMRLLNRFEQETFFSHTIAALGIKEENNFYKSFSRARTLLPDLQRISFLEFLQRMGENFSRIAFADMTWAKFYHDMKKELPSFGNF